MIRNIINLKAILLYFGLILCLIAGMPTPAYGSSSYPVKEESYVLVINSYVDGERWSGNLLNMISKFATPEEYTLRIDHISVMLVMASTRRLSSNSGLYFTNSLCKISYSFLISSASAGTMNNNKELRSI